MKRIIVYLLFTFTIHVVFAQDSYKCYPTNWWTGMHWNKVQVMVHGDAIAIAAKGYSINYPGVKLIKINKVDLLNNLE